jgi:hypothetical protein
MAKLKNRLMNLKRKGIDRPELFGEATDEAKALRNLVKGTIGPIRQAMGDTGRMSDFDQRFFDLIHKDVGAWSGIFNTTDSMLKAVNQMIRATAQGWGATQRAYTEGVGSMLTSQAWRKYAGQSPEDQPKFKEK